MIICIVWILRCPNTQGKYDITVDLIICIVWLLRCPNTLGKYGITVDAAEMPYYLQTVDIKVSKYLGYIRYNWWRCGGALLSA